MALVAIDAATWMAAEGLAYRLVGTTAADIWSPVISQPAADWQQVIDGSVLVAAFPAPIALSRPAAAAMASALTLWAGPHHGAKCPAGLDWIDFRRKP